MVLSGLKAARHALPIALGALGLSLMAVGPAGAQSAFLTAEQCQQLSGLPAVYSAAINQGQTIVMKQELSGDFVAVVNAEVYCKAPTGQNLGDIPDARIQVSVTGSSASMVTIQALDGVTTSAVTGGPS